MLPGSVGGGSPHSARPKAGSLIMKRTVNVKLFSGAMLATALSLCGEISQAQPPGGPPPGGPGFRPGGFGRQEISVANAPVEALAGGLKLTASQKDKISK